MEGQNLTDCPMDSSFGQFSLWQAGQTSQKKAGDNDEMPRDGGEVKLVKLWQTNDRSPTEFTIIIDRRQAVEKLYTVYTRNKRNERNTCKLWGMSQWNFRSVSVCFSGLVLEKKITRQRWSSLISSIPLARRARNNEGLGVDAAPEKVWICGSFVFFFLNFLKPVGSLALEVLSLILFEVEKNVFFVSEPGWDTRDQECNTWRFSGQANIHRGLTIVDHFIASQPTPPQRNTSQ